MLCIRLPTAGAYLVSVNIAVNLAAFTAGYKISRGKASKFPKGQTRFTTKRICLKTGYLSIARLPCLQGLLSSFCSFQPYFAINFLQLLPHENNLV